CRRGCRTAAGATSGRRACRRWSRCLRGRAGRKRCGAPSNAGPRSWRPPRQRTPWPAPVPAGPSRAVFRTRSPPKRPETDESCLPSQTRYDEKGRSVTRQNGPPEGGPTKTLFPDEADGVLFVLEARVFKQIRVEGQVAVHRHGERFRVRLGVGDGHVREQRAVV